MPSNKFPLHLYLCPHGTHGNLHVGISHELLLFTIGWKVYGHIVDLAFMSFADNAVYHSIIWLPLLAITFVIMELIETVFFLCCAPIDNVLP